ncbi:MAG: flagellar assembly peptidoglycan hydrolase FlgJ [Pseudomonadales bacterium]|nr:flagellar assembly peptidoglycan hydrolase FlgJ [Pseudomonadales bacterium]
MNTTNSPSSDMYLDFAQFQQMRKLSRDDQSQGLKMAAQQMESLFLSMVLKSMREANAVFAEGNMLQSQEGDYYQSMYDQQLAVNIGNNGGLGLAELMVRQLSGQGHESAFRPERYTGPLQRPRTEAIPKPSGPVPANASAVDIKPESTAAAAPAAEDSQPLWQDAKEFLQYIFPHAQAAARSLGVNVRAIMAQAVLETGWGQHVMDSGSGQCSFNLFGIKADGRWDGDVTRKKTLEYRNGIAAQEQAAFRSYRSLDEAFEDYVSFLRNNDRYSGVVGSGEDAQGWGHRLQRAGYATDPHYGNKIANILESDVFQSTLHTLTKQF